MIVHTILLLTTVSSVSCLGFPVSENRYRLIADVIGSLEKIMAYYQRTYQEMNVDGIFGLKVAEGQTSLILRSKGRFKIPPTYLKRVESIYVQTVNISSQSLPYLKRTDEVYFKRAEKLLKPWRVWLGVRELDDKLVWKSSQFDFKFHLNEAMSDKCLGELFDSTKSCEISQPCIDVMLKKRGTRGYTTAHQVLYTHVVHLVDCTASVNRRMSRTSNTTWTLARWENELCANILASLTERLVTEMGITTEQDLFIEEIFVCGVLGFSVFTRPSFARNILMWQDASGCFASQDRGGQSERLRAMMMNKRRSLLEEKDLPDGCLAHKTSVALGALSALLHSFIENDARPLAYIPPKHTFSLPLNINDQAEVIDLNEILPYKQLEVVSEAKPTRSYSHIQWAFPLITVVLTLVLLWRIRAFRLCRRKSMSTN